MKRENLTNWMRGGIILISVLLMGLSSCDCPSPDGGFVENNIILPNEPIEEGWWKDPEEVKKEIDGVKKKREEDEKTGKKDMARGQTFILSLNALAGENDSYTYTDAKGNKRTISGIDEAEYAANKIYKLNSTIEANLKKFAPGGIYISAENLKALAIDVGVSGPAQNALKAPLKELITLLKRMGESEDVNGQKITAKTKEEDLTTIEPLIITQEGGQFQRLLTAEINKSGDWQESDLGKQLGLKGLPIKVGVTGGERPIAADGTRFAWATIWRNPGGTKAMRDQVHALGFSLNYWLVGGTLRGPGRNAFANAHRMGRVQTSANVLGYNANDNSVRGSIRKLLKDWRKKKMITLIGDFPGKAFADHVKTSPTGAGFQSVWSFRNEMQWGELASKKWTYFDSEAEAAKKGLGRRANGNRGRDRLNYYAEAINAKVNIVGLSQDPLHGLGQHPWKSRDLIRALRVKMGFGEKGVVMVGDRTALIRDKHPKWVWTDNKYYGIGREMSTVIQLNEQMVKDSLLADADLFHLWRIDTKTITYGPYTNKVKLERESALDTVQKIFDKIKNNSDPDLKERLEESRGRIMEMKITAGFRVPVKTPPTTSTSSTNPPATSGP